MKQCVFFPNSPDDMDEDKVEVKAELRFNQSARADDLPGPEEVVEALVELVQNDSAVDSFIVADSIEASRKEKFQSWLCFPCSCVSLVDQAQTLKLSYFFFHPSHSANNS